MTQMTDYMENKRADKTRGQGITYPSSWYLAPLSAAADGSITELTGIGLARVAQARSLANFAGTQGPGTILASSGTSHASSNNNNLNFGTPTGSGTMTHVGFMDAASGGNCWIYVPVTAVVITAGSPDPVEILAGALTVLFGIRNGASDYLANKDIDEILRGQAYAWPSTMYMAAFSTAPTNAGGGVELSGGGYARAPIEASLDELSGTQAPGSTSASSGTSGRISNNLTVAHPDPTADLPDVVAGGLMDAPAGGNLLLWRQFGRYVPALPDPPVYVTFARSVRNGGPALSYAPDELGITFA